MRALHQGAAREHDRVADGGAVADLRARRGRGAARPPDLTERRLVGVILAGGASRRFGGAPKGLEPVDGARVVDRVREALGPVAGDVIVSANHPDAGRWLPGLTIVPDQLPGTGGLAGVHAALGHADGADVVVVAWDMPFITASLLQLVRDRFIASGADACVPESDSPHGIEPFCACYSARVRERLAAFLKGGGGSARDFLEQCTVERVPLADVARIGDPARLFLSVNDRADLARARETRD